MPQERPSWDWPYERPEWEPLPQRPPATPPRSPGRTDDRLPRVIAASERDDTSVIERELERRLRNAGRGAPPPRPPQSPPLPPWSPGDGTDKCAWYLSFRYGSAFGIYICVKCIDQIAEVLWQHGMEYARAHRVAFAFLYGHEQFHYRVDRGVEMLENASEVATGIATQLWLQRWVTSRHNSPGNGLDLLEEACANQQALSAAMKEAGDLFIGTTKRKRPKVDGDRDKAIAKYVLSEMMTRSAPGYRDFDRVSRPNVGDAQNELMSWYLQLSPGGGSKSVVLISGISMLIPRPVKYGNLNTDPEVPLYLVDC